MEGVGTLVEGLWGQEVEGEGQEAGTVRLGCCFLACGNVTRE